MCLKKFSLFGVLILIAGTIGLVRPECVHGDLYSHETSCEHFYQCVHGELIELKCRYGLHFNPNINVCNHPENVMCEFTTDASTTVTDIPPTTAIPTTNELPPTTDRPSETALPTTIDRPTETALPTTTDRPTTNELPSTTDRPTETALPTTTDRPTTNELPPTTDRPTETALPTTTDRPTETALPTTNEAPSCSTEADLHWHCEEDGSRWAALRAYDCDFPGYDIKIVIVSMEQCATICRETVGCTRYTWSGLESLYSNWFLKDSPNDANYKQHGGVCGYI